MIKREEYLLEPEGYAVPPPDPDDPWNPDNFSQGEGGDWDSPQACWANPNEDWKTPASQSKPQPSCFVSCSTFLSLQSPGVDPVFGSQTSSDTI